MGELEAARVRDAMRGTRRFVVRALGDVAVAVRRLSEPEIETITGGPEIESGPGARALAARDTTRRRLVLAALYDADTIDDDEPVRFFANASDVTALDEDTIAGLVRLVLEHQRYELAGMVGEQQGTKPVDDALRSMMGPLGALRAEHPLELCAFYGVRSALWDLTDAQVLAWARLRARVTARQSEPEPESKRTGRRARTNAR